MPLALDVLVRHSVRAGVRSARSWRASKTSSSRRSARSTTRPTTWCSSSLQVVAFPDQPLGRSILGTPETVRSFDRRGCAPISARNYRGPDMVVAAAGAVDHRGGRRRGGAAFAGFDGPRGAAAGAGALRRRHPHREARSRAGARCARAAGRAAERSVALQPAGVHQRARRRHVIAAVSGSAREARALLFDLRLPLALFGHRPVRRSMPAPTPPTPPS